MLPGHSRGHCRPSSVARASCASDTCTASSFELRTKLSRPIVTGTQQWIECMWWTQKSKWFLDCLMTQLFLNSLMQRLQNQELKLAALVSLTLNVIGTWDRLQSYGFVAKIRVPDTTPRSSSPSDWHRRIKQTWPPRWLCFFFSYLIPRVKLSGDYCTFWVYFL